MLLKVVWDVDPILFQFGGFTMRWYALAFVLAIPTAYFTFRYFLRRENLNTKHAIGLTEYGFFGVLIGARLGQVLFYELLYYLENPIEIFQIWKGGLASHGAFLGVLLASYLYARKKDAPSFLWIVDRGTVAICLCACLARIGNLFNSEIYGTPTDLPWAFKFTRVDFLWRHPSQLYDALLVFLLALVLLRVYKMSKLPKGLMLGLFFLLGFGIRTILEIWKANAWISSSLSVPIITTGVFLTALSLKRFKGEYPA